jgi:hypothetical protein
MADVEMSDAPVAKKADGVVAKGGDKKKFEVKKVCSHSSFIRRGITKD